MIFILGIERSATTWVANILDHHRKTEVFMEPLSAFNSRFKKWPDRFEKIENFEEKADYFKREFQKLKSHCRFLLTRFSDTPDAWQTDLKWAQYLVKKRIASAWMKDFIELNFHRKGQEFITEKQPPLQTVIKELRLNFNAELISKLDKQARVLVVIRELATCARSILQQFKQGNLVELQQSMLRHYGEKSLQTIATYWLKSYVNLIESLQQSGIRHQIVSHTKLLENSSFITGEMFKYLDLEISRDVQKYLEVSNQSGAGKHSTKRSSAELLEQLINDRKEIYPQIVDVLEKAQNHPILKEFVTSEC